MSILHMTDVFILSMCSLLVHYYIQLPSCSPIIYFYIISTYNLLLLNFKADAGALLTFGWGLYGQVSFLGSVYCIVNLSTGFI